MVHPPAFCALLSLRRTPAFIRGYSERISRIKQLLRFQLNFDYFVSVEVAIRSLFFLVLLLFYDMRKLN